MAQEEALEDMQDMLRHYYSLAEKFEFEIPTQQEPEQIKVKWIGYEIFEMEVK